MKRGAYPRYYARYCKRYLRYIYRIIRRKFRILKRKKVEYPSTIQLPITHLCNFDCVMCGMHHMINRKDFSAEELGQILSDKLFSNVSAIGVNGGEPFLKQDFVDCIAIMAEKCPKLEVINIISNGYFTEKIIKCLKEIKEICDKKHISINLAISVDGVDDMQDFHRGRKLAFVNAVNTINEVRKLSLVNGISCICTITKYNIHRIDEVEVWAKNNDIEVSYNIATENVRIENEDRVDSFSIFSDEQARMLAMEFFYKQYTITGQEKYFGLYLYLRDKKRYSKCPCQYNEWVTLTPDGEIGYCATHSEKLGNALNGSAYDIFQSNSAYLKDLCNTYCETCSHYMYELDTEGLKELMKDELHNQFLRG